MRAYDEAHREARREKDRTRHHADKPRFNAQSSAWRAANLERARLYDRERYAANKEKRKAMVRATRARHPARVLANRAARRARKRAAVVPLTPHEQAEVIALYAKARALTELVGEPYHVDHIKPLAKGGLHHPSNLQVLKGAENIRKGARWG